MSWTAHATIATLDDLDTLVLDDQGFESSERDEQFEAAKEAVRSMLEKGVIGEPPWNIAINGYASPNHERQDGWQEDHVTIVIHQHDPKRMAFAPPEIEEHLDG